MSTAASYKEESRGLNILCIDGGGARGLSSLVVLQEVMNRLRGLEGASGALIPADCFDIIAGSGTGGLSACMLGRLRMPLDQAIQEYAKLIQDVFADKKMIRTSGPSAYKGTKLQEALRRIVRKHGKGEEMMEENGKSASCKTIVFAMSKHNMNATLPTMFRSYSVAANRAPECTISDALYATMAHPNLFKDIEIGGSALSQSFVSGDLGCSNPIAHVLAEVKRVYPGRHVSCILSIGAGHARTISIPIYSLTEHMFQISDLITMKDMATDGERVAEEMAVRFGATRGLYFRFNVDQGVQGMEAGEWEKLRDVVAHAKAYLFKADTGRKLEELVQAIKSRITTLEVGCIDGQIQQRYQARRPPRIKRCPAPTPVYTGRVDEAKQVRECLLESSQERPICVIYGLGGSGKTQLVLKVVEQTQNEWSEVLYIDATSTDAIESALKRFAEARNLGHMYQDTTEWLSSHLKRWLIVFDNVDDPSVSANIRHYFPDGTHGSILITTRLTDLAFLARGPGSVCHLKPGMKPEDSLALLIKVARLVDLDLSETEMGEARALMTDFGHLALAIVHAGAYIAHSPGLTISKYRKMFHSQSQRMLERYTNLKVPVDDYTKTVYTTWEMCYSLLKQDSRPMLWLMAFLHHGSITEKIFERAATNIIQSPLSRVFLFPKDEVTTDAYNHVRHYLSQFLDATREWDSLLFLSAVSEIASYSLIDFDRMNNAYNVHVLVQDWAKTKIEQTRALALECTATLLSLAIGFDDTPESCEFMISLELHLDCFMSNEQPASRDYHRQFAKAYRELKRWRQVQDLASRAYQGMHEARGEKHMFTLGCMVELASAYFAQERLDEAEELQTKALKFQTETLGHNHPQTQQSVTNLASIYLKQKRWEESEKLQRQALRYGTQLWPWNCSPSQSVTRLQTTDQQETIVERDFLNELRAKTNIALVCSNQGRLTEAEALQTEVLTAYRAKYTEKHQETMAAMSHLALTYYKQKRWDESAELCLKLAAVQAEMNGGVDPDTLKAVVELVAIYIKQDQWTKAEPLQRQIIDSNKQTLGADNPDTLKAMAELAVIYSKQDRWADAEPLQWDIINAYKRTLGARDPNTLRTMIELAVAYLRRGQWTEAEPLQDDIILSYERAPGVSALVINMVIIMAELVVTYSTQAQWSDATILRDRIRQRCEQMLDRKSQSGSIGIIKLGVLYFTRGLMIKVAELHQRILDLQLEEYASGTKSDIEMLDKILAELEEYDWWLDLRPIYLLVLELASPLDVFQRCLVLAWPAILDYLMLIIGSFVDQLFQPLNTPRGILSFIGLVSGVMLFIYAVLRMLS